MIKVEWKEVAYARSKISKAEKDNKVEAMIDCPEGTKSQSESVPKVAEVKVSKIQLHNDIL